MADNDPVPEPDALEQALRPADNDPELIDLEGGYTADDIDSQLRRTNSRMLPRRKISFHRRIP